MRWEGKKKLKKLEIQKKMPPKPPAKKVAERQAMTHFFSPDRNAEKVAQKAQETLQLAENADRLRVRLAEYLG